MAIESVSRLRIQVIGGFSVNIGGRYVGEDSWPSRRSSELVQLLSLADGHSLSRDQAMEAIWPHLSPAAAAANLRKAAHHARRALGSRDGVSLRRGVVALLPTGEVTTDLREFEEAAREALVSGKAANARRVIERFRGELLPSALYEEWTRAARTRLRTTRVELMKVGRLWTELIELEPLDETGYRESMREAMQAGNRAGAIQLYGRLRSMVAAELSTVPGPETQALYRECVAAYGGHIPTLVGRDVVLATGASVLRSESGVRCLTIRGQLGVGKTRLSAELTSHAATEGWATFTTSCTAVDRPYRPLMAIVAQLLSVAGIESVPQPYRRVISVLSGDESGMDEPLARHAVIRMFQAVLDAVVGEQSALIVFDDAHLSDEATVDVLLHWLATTGSAKAFTIVTYEPGSAPNILVEGLSRLRRQGRSLEIELEPLNATETTALVRQMSDARLPDETLAQVFELSEGNPALALELARSIDAEGHLDVTSSVWDAALVWCHDMDDGSVALLERLAVVEVDLTTDEVLTVTGLRESEAHRFLDRALEIGVLDVDDGRYRFSRELARRALARRVPPHRQSAVHRDVARRLAASDDAVPERVAHHWMEAGRPAEARPWLMAAARRAIAVGAFADSLQGADRILTVHPSDADALVMRADSLAALGRPEAVTAYGKAARHARGDESQDLKARMALTQLKCGDPAGALQTLDSVNPVTVSGRIWEALTLSGAAAIGFADAEVAAVKAAQARRLALESGDSGAVVEASWALSLAAHARGDLRSSLRADLALTAGLEDLAIRVFDGHLCATERLLYGSYPYDEVVEFAESLRAESRRLGTLRGEGFALTLSGEAKLLSGHLEGAVADLDEAAALNRRIGATAGEALALQRRAEVERYLGNNETGRSLLARALSVARDSYLGHHLYDRIYGALITIADDGDRGLAQVEEAEQAVVGPQETCPACRITLEVPAAIAAARAGDLVRARRHTDAVCMLSQVMVPQPGWKAAAEEVRGHLALAERRNERARERFQRAAELYRSAGQPLDASRCELAADS